MPIGRDTVESAVAAAAVATVHGRVATAETLTHLWQPIAVGRFVVIVRIDGVLNLFAGQAADVKHVAVRRLEVDSLDEVAINRATATGICRPTKQSHLSPAGL